MRRPFLDDRGAVTAEFAAALPAIILVLTLALGALVAAAASVRLEHTAAESARLLGRGDEQRARAVVADAGADLSFERNDTLVCVDVSAPVPLPIALEPLRAHACALVGGG